MSAEQWLLALEGARPWNFVTFSDHDPYQISCEEEVYVFPSIKQLCPYRISFQHWPPYTEGQGIYYVTAAEPGKVEYRLG